MDHSSLISLSANSNKFIADCDKLVANFISLQVNAAEWTCSHHERSFNKVVLYS